MLPKPFNTSKDLIRIDKDNKIDINKQPIIKRNSQIDIKIDFEKKFNNDDNNNNSIEENNNSSDLSDKENDKRREK